MWHSFCGESLFLCCLKNNPMRVCHLATRASACALRGKPVRVSNSGIIPLPLLDFGFCPRDDLISERADVDDDGTKSSSESVVPLSEESL